MSPLLFRYTAHAEYQLFNRNISKQSAEYTVNHPDELYVDREDATVSVAVRETSPGTFLKVWYRLENGELAVQTALIITLRRERPAAERRMIQHMEVRVDREADAAYIRLRRGKVARTEELPGGYLLDYSRAGKVLGIEVLHLSKKMGSDQGVSVPERIWKLAQ